MGGHDGYLTVGMYEDGRPGEIFIVMAKAGSTLGDDGLVRDGGVAGLQHGVPLELFVNKFAHVRFEPHGFTKNSDIPIAKSIIDYLFRWLGIKFLGHAPASVSHEAAKEDPLEAHGVQPVSENQLSLINGITKHGSLEPPVEDTPFVSQTDALPAPSAARSWCGGARAARPQLRRDERLQLIRAA